MKCRKAEKGVKNMILKEKKILFEKNIVVYEQAKLKFYGVDGYDVYNCSVPFYWNEKRYMFGRVEKRSEWASSWSRLFTEIGKDQWLLVEDSVSYPLEDPCVSFINNELVMCGTHVQYSVGKLATYYAYFYRGTNIKNLEYFTTGPERMKDIRLVQLLDGRIGFFSRPRGNNVLEKYGSESMVGFDVIDSLEEFNDDKIKRAPFIRGLFNEAEWGGCNQAYALDSGLIGCIGHSAYNDISSQGNSIKVYANTAFVIDPTTRELLSNKIIGTRKSYPEGMCKKEHLVDCVFTSGILARTDGKVDLYSGLGDCEQGRIVIDNPFDGFGYIVGDITNRSK